jgi:CRISPR-associated protein Csm1
VTLSEDHAGVATRQELGARAEGRPLWGVLRGDVDSFAVRLKRAQTVEEHIQLSWVYKQFFAGELQLQCSLPDFWRKVNIVYSGGDDFAVYGAWDALVLLAREIQRLFHRLSEENLKDFPGAEGKTLTMALALAGDVDAPLAAVYGQAGERLELAKSSGKDCIYLFGRTLEWRLLNDAIEMKEMMMRMVRDFGCSPQFLAEIGGFYNESTETAALRKRTERGNHFDRPWRFNRRLGRVMGGPKEREFQKLRASLVNEFVARGTAQLKLRPTGRVALEWARLLTGAAGKS